MDTDVSHEVERRLTALEEAAGISKGDEEVVEEDVEFQGRDE